MKIPKFITIAALAAAVVGEISPRLAAQQSYDQVIANIASFEKEKKYAVETTGPLLDCILNGMIDNDGQYFSEGLKRRLVAFTFTSKIKLQAKAAINPGESNLLELLSYTRQCPVPAFITDVQLRGRVVHNGAVILAAERAFWKQKVITTNMIEGALENYPPWIAASVVDIISRTYYQDGNVVYEDLDTSWASQSLWQIYYYVRQNELAKRSVIVKLLSIGNYIPGSGEVDAYFTYSGWPDIPIFLDPVFWTSEDIPELERLLANPYYSTAAQQVLDVIGNYY